MTWLSKDNRRFTKLLVLGGVILALPAVLPSGFYFRIATLIWIFGFAAIGLNILMGDAGQISLGHAGFIGIGAYATALLPAYSGISSSAAILCGVLISGVIAYIVGRAVLRLKGHFLSIATLGMGTLIALVILTEAKWTGGPDGISVQTLTVFGYPISSLQQWYWISGGVLWIGAFLALSLQKSSTGRAMRALRDSEIAASVAGIDIARYKLLAFVLAAIYASISGSMIALANRFITPDQAGFLQSIELVMMVIIGGLGSVLGSVVGAAVIVLLPQLLAVLHDYEQLILGLILMLSVGFFPQGVVPGVANAIARVRSR